MEQKKAPPIGIIPEWLWKEKRLEELKETIERHEKSGIEPLKLWLLEAEKLEHEIIKSKFSFKRSMKEENNMDENSTIGGFPADIDAITKKMGKGDKATPEDIAAVTKGCNTTDMLFMLAFLLLLSGWGGNSSADYWRGKYDAYKEINEKE